MAEYNSTEKLKEIQDLIEKIQWNQSNAISDVNAGMYFTLGGYANDAWQLVGLFAELTSYLQAGGVLPEQWENVKRFFVGATVAPISTGESDPAKPRMIKNIEFE